ncbi:MAG: carbohydrate ABC transporter permease [Lachnospiraceae bacterium]
MGREKKAKEPKVKRKKRKAGKLARRDAIAGLLFVSPWIVGALLLLVYTMGTSFWYALNNIRITPLGKKFTFVGTGNFTQILMTDADFPTQLVEYMTSTIISVPVIVVFALIIAMLLNGKIKCKGFFRLIFFLPVIVVSGPVMGMLSEQGAATISTIDTQAITNAISAFLPKGVATAVSELFENMITILWYSGVQILIFLSALQKIDRSMYEAAEIDGGSGWECFWKITLPNVKPMILLNVIYTVVFISGNEQNAIINLIQRSMFSGIKEKGYGYASAMAWLYSLVVLVIVGLFALILTARKDVYERQVKKVKKEQKKQARNLKQVERRGRRNAKRNERAKKRGRLTTYSGDGDY